MKFRISRLCKFISSNKWIIVGFILVTLFLFSNYLYGYKLSFTNANYSFLPFKSYGIETKGPLLTDIADSHYPLVHSIFYDDEKLSLWESDVALGKANNVFSEIMNPMDWVYLTPFETGIFLKSFSEFALAFFAMFLYMRAIGVRKYSAALSGVIYAFSATMVAWLGWKHSDVAAWAPMLFFAMEKLISTMKIKYMMLSALSIYVMLIVGMPTYAAYFLYLGGAYIVVFTIIRHWKNKKNILIVAGMFAASVILAGLASLPYTSSLLTSVVGNGYSASREYLGEEKLDIEYLRTCLFPYIRDGFTIHFNESTLYTGVISVVLLPLVLCNNRNKKRNIFFIVASVIIFLLIFTDTLTFIYTKLPLISTSRKYRVITLLMFTWAVLGGVTLNDIFVNKEYYKKKVWLLIPVSVWVSGVVFLSAKDIYSAHSSEVITVVGLIVALLLCLGILIKRDFKLVYIILAVLVILDSAQFAKGYLPWIDAQAEIIPEATDTVEYLMDNTQNEERIAGVGGWVLFPNSNIYYGLNDVRTHGFEATNSDMVAYYKQIDETAYPSRTRIELHNIANYELLKYVGVRYIYGSGVSESVAGSGRNLVFKGIDSLEVFEFDEYSKKVELIENVNILASEEAILDEMSAEFVPNTLFISEVQENESYNIPLSENESVELVEYRDDYVKVICNTEYDRYLMLNDYYDSDWKAYVNGEETDIKKANYLMRAVKLESGEDVLVEFKYEPCRVYIMAGISVISIVASVLIFIFGKKLQQYINR